MHFKQIQINSHLLCFSIEYFFLNLDPRIFNFSLYLIPSSSSISYGIYNCTGAFIGIPSPPLNTFIK